MKTRIKKLKLAVLLIGLIILSSCSNRVAVGNALGINIIFHTIPAATMTFARFSEHKIAAYLKSSPTTKNEKVITDKKVEKKGRHHKVKPISIGVSREVRLV